MIKKVAASCVLFFLSIAVNSAHANTTITLYGNTVSFTYNPSSLGLYGHVSVVGDSLIFTPTEFALDSFNRQAQPFVASSGALAKQSVLRKLDAFNVHVESLTGGIIVGVIADHGGLYTNNINDNRMIAELSIGVTDSFNLDRTTGFFARESANSVFNLCANKPSSWVSYGFVDTSMLSTTSVNINLSSLLSVESQVEDGVNGLSIGNASLSAITTQDLVPADSTFYSTGGAGYVLDSSPAVAAQSFHWLPYAATNAPGPLRSIGSSGGGGSGSSGGGGGTRSIAPPPGVVVKPPVVPVPAPASFWCFLTWLIAWCAI